MKKFLIIIYLISFGFVFAQSKTGSTAAPFLNIAVGSRAISMGGAFVATADDVSSLYWNPAGAARMNTNSAMFTHTRWFADISYEWAGAAINMGNLGMMGLSITYLDYGDMEVTTLQEPDGTGQTFSAHDMAIALSYGKNLTDRFSIGGSAKYVEQKIKNTSANAVAFDVGVLFLSNIYGLRIGASITNFGSDMKLSGKDLLVAHDVDPNIEGNNDQILADLRTDEFPLPLTFKVGLGMDVVKTKNHKVAFGVDALHPKDNAEYLNIGGEYLFHDMIALRAGYKSLFLDNSEEGLTLGFGIGYNFAPNLRLQLDYAYQDMDVLEKSQHFSLGIKF